MKCQINVEFGVEFKKLYFWYLFTYFMHAYALGLNIDFLEIITIV